MVDPKLLKFQVPGAVVVAAAIALGAGVGIIHRERNPPAVDEPKEPRGSSHVGVRDALLRGIPSDEAVGNDRANGAESYLADPRPGVDGGPGAPTDEGEGSDMNGADSDFDEESGGGEYPNTPGGADGLDDGKRGPPPDPVLHGRAGGYSGYDPDGGAAIREPDAGLVSDGGDDSELHPGHGYDRWDDDGWL